MAQVAAYNTNKRILVVDDNPDTRLLTKYNLELEGYDVEIADSGSTAFNELVTKAYDLLIIDLLMGGGGNDGDIALAHFRRTRPELHSLPVILFTNVDPARAEKRIPDGVHYLWKKRVDAVGGETLLIDKIKEVLRNASNTCAA